MDRFELQKLRDLPIEGVAERLGMQVVRHKALCPFHDDHHASLSFSTRHNTFRCFACDAHGGTIDLVMRYLNKDFKEACKWLGLPPSCSPEGENRSEASQKAPHQLPRGGESNSSTPAPHQLPRGGESNSSTTQEASPRGGLEGAGGWEGAGFDASRFSRFFDHPFLLPEARRFLFTERRLDERVVRWCRLTSWKDRREVPWLQIPYYDQNWRLTGVQNRNLVTGGLPRFRFPQGSECGIYNLPVLNMLTAGERLWIAEGCSDCWALLSTGRKAIAIPSATLLSRKDKALLTDLSARLSTEFHMFPDRDVPGERLFLQLRQVLPGLVHHQLPPGCKDFGEYYLTLHTKAV